MQVDNLGVGSPVSGLPYYLTEQIKTNPMSIVAVRYVAI